MFSLYQISAAHLTESFLRDIYQDFSLPDSNIKGCCRGIITGQFNKTYITKCSIKNDHLNCFIHQNRIKKNYEYHVFISWLASNKSSSDSRIFKYILQHSTISYKSLWECIQYDNISMYKHILMYSNRLFINSIFLERIVLHQKTTELLYIFEYVDKIFFHCYRRNMNITDTCVKYSNIDILKILHENDFVFYNNAISDMIDFRQYEMVEYALCIGNGFIIDVNVIMYKIIQHFNEELLRSCKHFIETNERIFVDMVTRYIDADEILKLYTYGVIPHHTARWIFEYTVINNYIHKTGNFLNYGFNAEIWMIHNKIMFDDLEYIKLFHKYRYIYTELDINIIINIPSVSFDIVYFIMSNAVVTNISELNVVNMVEHNYPHNLYIFKRMLKCFGSLILNEAIFNIIIQKNMIYYYYSISKYLNYEDVKYIIRLAKIHRRYIILLHLFIIKIRLKSTHL